MIQIPISDYETLQQDYQTALKTIVGMIELYGECTYTDTGYCIKHEQDNCPVSFASAFIATRMY